MLFRSPRLGFWWLCTIAEATLSRVGRIRPVALPHAAGALPTQVLIASGLLAFCASCRCSWWRPPPCPVLPSLLSASLMPAAPLGWGSGATEQSPPFLGQLCSPCRTRADFVPLTASFRLSSLSDAQHLLSFRCPSFSSCNCFCSGFRTQPPPTPAMLLLWGAPFPTCHSLMAQRLKRLPAMWETWVQSLGREDPQKRK